MPGSRVAVIVDRAELAYVRRRRAAGRGAADGGHAYTVGPSVVDATQGALANMDPDTLATHLIGGVTRAELMEYADKDLELYPTRGRRAEQPVNSRLE